MKGIQIAVAWADIIICGIWHSIEYVIAWVLVAAMMVFVYRKSHR